MTTDYLKEQLLQSAAITDGLSTWREQAMSRFDRFGIPTVRNEEWKYTRISSIFNKQYVMAGCSQPPVLPEEAWQLPGHDTANVLVFVNGCYSAEQSRICSEGLQVLPLETAAASAEYGELVGRYLDHSAAYLEDGLQALNTAYIQGGVFLHVAARQVLAHPVYIYHIADARTTPVLAQPRSLAFISRAAELTIAETYITEGTASSLTNQVMELVVEQDAQLHYYKIQNDTAAASQVNTLHVQQIGKSMVNIVTVTLGGAIVRNNLHVIMEAPYTEAHLYGLYALSGNTHVDNHTVVDNAMPGCESNELYKGILDGQSTGVFNGKVFVRKDAQKINAFQSNKNILLSEAATVNTKPQLEIFADDVKCSHGCTVGSVDSEALFYLQSRGIPRKEAQALLLQGFATDVLEQIRMAPLRHYVEQLIVNRLNTTQL